MLLGMPGNIPFAWYHRAKAAADAEASGGNVHAARRKSARAGTKTIWKQKEFDEKKVAAAAAEGVAAEGVHEGDPYAALVVQPGPQKRTFLVFGKQQNLSL